MATRRRRIAAAPRQHLDRRTGDAALGRPVALGHLREQVLDPVEGRAARLEHRPEGEERGSGLVPQAVVVTLGAGQPSFHKTLQCMCHRFDVQTGFAEGRRPAAGLLDERPVHGLLHGIEPQRCQHGRVGLPRCPLSHARPTLPRCSGRQGSEDIATGTACPSTPGGPAARRGALDHQPSGTVEPPCFYTISASPSVQDVRTAHGFHAAKSGHIMEE
ncbi:hypothetical protein CJD44_02970 [Streptomyces sp. alain-838]|nr:hypothetical protein CJD44_02970 [Streptomyces sp. alain-838]